MTKQELEEIVNQNDARIAKYEAQDAKRKLYHQSYNIKHAERIAEYHKTYNAERKANKVELTPEQIEKARLYHANYNATHREAIRAYHKTRNAEIKAILAAAKNQ
jgi:hypothetical protein